MDWFLDDNGLRHERVIILTEIWQRCLRRNNQQVIQFQPRVAQQTKWLVSIWNATMGWILKFLFITSNKYFPVEYFTLFHNNGYLKISLSCVMYLMKNKGTFLIVTNLPSGSKRQILIWPCWKSLYSLFIYMDIKDTLDSCRVIGTLGTAENMFYVCQLQFCLLLVVISLLSLKSKISAIWLIEKACIVAAVQISMECEAQESSTGSAKYLNLY